MVFVREFVHGRCHDVDHRRCHGVVHGVVNELAMTSSMNDAMTSSMGSSMDDAMVSSMASLVRCPWHRPWSIPWRRLWRVMDGPINVEYCVYCLPERALSLSFHGLFCFRRRAFFSRSHCSFFRDFFLYVRRTSIYEPEAVVRHRTKSRR